MSAKRNDPEDTSTDGRSARWEDHRESRREELVLAAVKAIDEHGPTASIAQVAASAGVSKPVLYRYFADKEDLYRAVGHWGANEVLVALLPTLRSREGIQEKISRGCRDYLRIIDAHPQVFFLLVEHRSSNDPLADGKERISAAFSRAMGDALRALGVDAAGAEPWAHGVVGLGLAHGEWWLRRRTMSRTAAATYLSQFIWHAFSGIAQDAGMSIHDGGLRLITPASSTQAPRPAKKKDA